MLLNSRTIGSGPAVIILHGLFGSLDNWNTVAERISDMRTVISMDLPNHGESAHLDRMDYDIMAEAVAATLTDLGRRRCDMLGHSMGGKAAMRFATRFSTRVRKLVVADIAPVDYPHHSHRNIIEGMRAVDLDRVESRRDADRQLQSTIPSKVIRAFLLKNLVKDDGAYYWRINLDAIESSYEEIRGYPDNRGGFDGPTLFIRGETSDYLGESEWEAAKQLFPNARRETLGGAGHWLHAERQEEFVRVLRDYLSEHE